MDDLWTAGQAPATPEGL